jgi:hypothetical protein
MQKYQDTALNNGRPVVGATVTVTTLAGAAATIYSDNGTTVITTLRTGDDGSFAFYAADGRYSIQISGSGITTKTITDVLLEDHSEFIVVTDYGSDSAAFTTAAALGSSVIVPQAAYALATAPTANSIGFITDGKATFSANFPPGAADGSVFGKAAQVMSYRAAAAGSAVVASANEFTQSVQMYVPATSAAASYEKAASYTAVYTVDPSTALILRDAVAQQNIATIGAVNTAGRAWATHSYAIIETGGDGYAVGHEIEVINNGSTQTAVDTVTSKYGTHIVAKGGRITAGVFFNYTTGSFENAIYAKANALNTNLLFLDSGAGGGLVADKVGRLTLGTTTAAAGSNYLKINPTGAGNVFGSLETASAVAGEGAFLQFTKTSVRNWNMGYDTGNDLFVATTGNSLADTTRWLTVTPALNIGFFSNAPSFGGGVKVMFLANATTEPTTNPVGGVIVYSFGGALKMRGSAGTVTTLGPA